MPSPAAARQLRSALFALPPSLRVSAYQSAALPRRAFSASSPRNGPVLDSIVSVPIAALDAVHSVGIPWFAAIPATAVLVRTASYYLHARPAHKNRIAQACLFPLITLRASEDLQRYRYFKIEQGDDAAAYAQKSKKELWFRPFTRIFFFYKWRKRTARDYGIPVISWRGLANFGSFIAFVEALRVKCGHREGLLAFLFGSSSSSTPTLSPDEALAQRIEAGYTAVRQAKMNEMTSDPTVSAEEIAKFYESQSHVLAEPVLLPPAPPQQTAYSDFLDATLQSEGFTWIQDLTIPDPTIGLPLALFLSVFASSFLTPSPLRIKDPDPQNPFKITDDSDSTSKPEAKNSKPPGAFIWQNPLANLKLSFGQKFMLVGSIAMFFVATKLPAALLLYMIPNYLMRTAQTLWLNVKYPMPPLIQGCKRPIRNKIRRDAW